MSRKDGVTGSAMDIADAGPFDVFRSGQGGVASLPYAPLQAAADMGAKVLRIAAVTALEQRRGPRTVIETVLGTVPRPHR